jgi:hypothetical protein
LSKPKPNRKNKRLYYLQTDQVTSEQLDDSIDNVCAKTQMTFSAKAEDIIDIIDKKTSENFDINNFMILKKYRMH